MSYGTTVADKVSEKGEKLLHKEGKSTELRTWLEGYGVILPVKLGRSTKKVVYKFEDESKSLHVDYIGSLGDNRYRATLKVKVSKVDTMSEECPEELKALLLALKNFELPLSSRRYGSKKIPSKIKLTYLLNELVPITKSGDVLNRSVMWLRWALAQDNQNKVWHSFLDYLKNVLESYSIVSSYSSTFSSMLCTDFTQLYLSYLEEASVLAFYDSQNTLLEHEEAKAIIVRKLGVLAAKMGILLEYRYVKEVSSVSVPASQRLQKPWTIQVSFEVSD